MIVDVLKKLRATLKPASVENGGPKDLDPIEILRLSYHDLSRLAQQIDNHAQRAPYPHTAERLRRIAAEKRQRAMSLKEQVLSLGGKLEEPDLDLKSGKNHWERMVRDLEDQRALETSFLDRAFRLAEEKPHISELLKRIVDEHVSHKEILLDLVTRADPQADQS